jgi:ribose 1,5-bisphosphokinase
MAIGPGAKSRIGPGRLVVVVGPSGAGKDTLLRLARAGLCSDPSVVFPRRIVTRAPSTDEDNEAITDAGFAATAAAGRFAFWWEAHGLKYGIDASIDDHVRAGITVVCNVSRGAIVALRRRYADLHIVLVTAPPDLLAARLAGRGRQSDGAVAARLTRAADGHDFAPDLVIENVGDPEDGAAKLVAAIAGRV